jgi:hypothetical protein
MTTAGIVISNSQTNIVSGYRYRVRLIADEETYEWYPYFVTYSVSQGWSGTSPLEFSDFLTSTPSGNSESNSEDGVPVAAIVVPIVIVVVGGLIAALLIWHLKFRGKYNDVNEKSTLFIPTLNP